MLLSIITFIVLLAILVLVHEFGHFIVAKWVGMRIDEFAFGFPPRIWGKQKGETLYAFNAIPLGGYVKIHGQGGEHDDDPRSFSNRPLWARIAVIVAGVCMNLLLAYLILVVAFSVGFTSISQDLTQVPGHVVERNDIYVADLLDGSAAAKAGIEAGDLIKTFNGTPITSDTQLQQLTKQVQKKSNRTASVSYLRGGTTRTVSVLEAPSGPALGIGLADEQVIRVPFWRAPVIAAKESGAIIGLTWQALKGFASELFVHGKLDPDVTGPVGIYQATATAAHAGIIPTVFLLVALSLNLAIMNILPIPALDGGWLLFLIIEGVFRRRVITEKVEAVISTIGFAVLMLLIAVLTVRDLIHL